MSQDSLQKRNRVTEIAQLNGGDRLEPKVRCVSLSSFSVLTAIAASLSQYPIRLRVRFVGAVTTQFHSKSSCGFSAVASAFVDLLCVLVAGAVMPFGFSRWARISLARSRISFGKPASRATWMP